MMRTRVGRHVPQKDGISLLDLEPCDYTCYKDESGQEIWMARCPNLTIVNLTRFQPRFVNASLSCNLPIKVAGWTGTLNKGIWTWEE